MSCVPAGTIYDCQPCYEAGCADDYKYNFEVKCSGTKLSVTEFKRTERFGEEYNNGTLTVYDRWCSWTQNNNWEVPLGKTTPADDWTVNGDTADDYRYDFCYVPAGTATKLKITEKSRQEQLSGDGTAKTITQSHGTFANSGKSWEIPLPVASGQQYCFDPDWFVVEGDNVRMRTAAINAVVNEALGELRFEVNVSGLADEVHDGRIYASTAASGRLADNNTISSTYSHE